MTPAPDESHADPMELVRTRSYVQLLLLAALVGVPISAAAYFFEEAIHWTQDKAFNLPEHLGFDSTPTWWPLPVLVVAGMLVGLAIRYLPGKGGHSPADGMQVGHSPSPVEIPGVVLAALAGLGLGVVLGPEAPLIALGAGLGALSVKLANRDAPPMAEKVISAAGSFAAISTLFGSPLLGAFLLMEASGLGGATLGVVLVPGLLAAGLGSLLFIGLDSLTGLGTFTLAIPGLPPFDRPSIAMFGWALGFGVAAAFTGAGLRWLALGVRPHVERRLALLMPIAGLVVGGLAVLFAEVTGESASNVLFSGQNQLPDLVSQAGSWSMGALLLLLVCKGIAYSISLGSFRGGPVFPAMFIGAAAGILGSHFPGLPLVPGVAMGIGAMCCAMLRLPLTSTLLATLLLGTNGLNVMPLVIVAVLVSYVLTARLTPVATAQE